MRNVAVRATGAALWAAAACTYPRNLPKVDRTRRMCRRRPVGHPSCSNEGAQGRWGLRLSRTCSQWLLRRGWRVGHGKCPAQPLSEQFATCLAPKRKAGGDAARVRRTVLVDVAKRGAARAALARLLHATACAAVVFAGHAHLTRGKRRGVRLAAILRHRAVLATDYTHLRTRTQRWFVEVARCAARPVRLVARIGQLGAVVRRSGIGTRSNSRRRCIGLIVAWLGRTSLHRKQRKRQQQSDDRTFVSHKRHRWKRPAEDHTVQRSASITAGASRTSLYGSWA